MWKLSRIFKKQFNTYNHNTLAIIIILLSIVFFPSINASHVRLATQSSFSQAPNITLVSGEGPFLKSSGEYKVEIKTDITAQCRFTSSANSAPEKRSFNQMYNSFKSNDLLNHNRTFKVQYNASQWSLWVKCRGDEDKNAITVYPTIIVTNFVDEIPQKEPIITVIQGQEQLPEGTNSYNVEINTNVHSRCKYATSANSTPAKRSFDQLPKSFNSSNGLKHDLTVSGLYKPKEWSVWVKCRGTESLLINELAKQITAIFDIVPPKEDKAPIFITTEFSINTIQNSIATIVANDPEAGAVTYRLVEDINDYFVLADDGVLTKKPQIKLHFGQSYQILVEAMDIAGKISTEEITIKVVSRAINQAPKLLTKEVDVKESTTNIAQLSSYDPEGTLVQYQLLDDSAEIFQLSEQGELTLKKNVHFDRTKQRLFSVKVSLTDADGVVATDTISVLVIPDEVPPALISINESEDKIVVVNDLDSITVWKSRFGLSVEHNGEKVITDINSSINYRAIDITQLEAPIESYTGKDWVEVRGWYWHADEDIDDGAKSHENGLYYSLRYQFFPGKPYIKIVFSLSDRHEGHPVEGQWQSVWEKQIAKDFTISIETAKTNSHNEVAQYSAHTGYNTKLEGVIRTFVDIDSREWRHSELSTLVPNLKNQTHLAKIENNDIQVSNVKHYKDTFLTIQPNHIGEVDLQLAQLPVTSRINDLQVDIKHSTGTTRVLVDQSKKTNDLGRFTLDFNSVVTMTSQHSGYKYDRYIFNRLHLIKDEKIVKTIKAKHITGKLFDTENYGIAVNNFWQKYPMVAKAYDNKIQLTTLTDASRIGPGAGISIDFSLNYDTHNARTSTLASLTRKPPQKSLPTWWHNFDGVNTSKVRNDSELHTLLAQTWSIIHKNDVKDNNYGWNNYGDFKISNSYTGTHADGYRYRHQNWGSQQVDLGLGLIISWMNTDDENLWHRAQAAVRNASDILIAKFEPLAHKRSGGGYRKGDCAVYNSHWCYEPLAAFGYHSRALLLNNHLTGEQWTKDIAQMVIDNGAYFAFTRKEWTAKYSDRTLGWVLRNLYYGAKVFPNGTKYLSKPEAGYPNMVVGTDYQHILNELLDEYIYQFEQAGSRLIGNQPIWQSRIIEGLIMALEGDLINATYTDKNNGQIKDKPEKIRQLIIEAVSYLDQNELRVNESGDFEMLYSRKNSTWTSLRSYGFFWLSSWQWVEQQSNTSLNHTSEEMFIWLVNQYKNKHAVTREWTAVMGSSTNFVDQRR